MILRDGKLGGGWYLIKVRDVTVKKFLIKYFCIIKENTAYMGCVIQRCMFYSFYLFLSILLCNADSGLVANSNSYIWISNCIQIFELYSNVRIYIRMLKECVLSTCSWKRASSDDVGEKISQLHQELVNAYKKKKSFFIGKRGGVCDERDVTQKGSREQTWQRVMMRGKWVKKGNFSLT